jgi:hypothetical protein
MTEIAQYKEDDINFLKLVLAANDEAYKLWPKRNVDFARKMCFKNWNRVPSLDDAVRELGLELAQKIYAEIQQWRAFDNGLRGHDSPCHYCKSTEELFSYNFAMMKVEDAKRNWGATLATAAIGAVTVPLLGAAAIRLPGKSFQGQAYQLRLIVCKPCTNKEGNWLGIFILNEERAAHHPYWKSLYERGFTKFLNEEKIPQELTYDSLL